MGRFAAALVGSLFWLGLLLCGLGSLASAEPRAPPNRIAIVGAGIGGTSSAYYLRKKFGKDVKIDVFEREEVGGRLATLKVQGHDYEAGGSVIHPLNLHMKRFVKELGLSSVPASGGLVGVYNGKSLVTTFIKGELNSTLFSSRPKDQFGLSAILVTDDSDMFINSLSIVASVRQKEGPPPAVDGMHVWKTFSRDILTKEQISKLFLSYDYAVRKPWLSYPHYEPPQKCPSIILHDRLYYLNGIEFAASCMEMSAIAGYNAALLAYHRWNGNEDMIDQDDLYERLKTEL